MDGMSRDGFAPVRNSLRRPYMMERDATENDIDGIVSGLGGNNKFRFGRGTSSGGETRLIRATQCHSPELGVAADELPVDEEVLYVAHGTSMEDARDIVANGLSRRERLHVHFHACDVAGRLDDATQMRRGTQVAIAVSDAHGRVDGLVFYRPSNKAILSSVGQCITRHDLSVARLDTQSRKHSGVTKQGSGAIRMGGTCPSWRTETPSMRTNWRMKRIIRDLVQVRHIMRTTRQSVIAVETVL